MPSGKHATGHTRKSGQLRYRTDAGKPHRRACPVIRARLRYEQVNAWSAFASAMTELKRGLITLWFYHQRDAAGATT